MYLYKPGRCCLLYTLAVWGSLLFLGYKPLEHVAVLDTVGNCNTVNGGCAPKHRNGTLKIPADGKFSAPL